MLKLTPLPRERNNSIIWTYRYDADVPYVTTQPDANVTEDAQLALITKEDVPQKQITRLIQKAFILRRASTSNFHWQHIRDLMYDSIVNCKVTTIEATSKALKCILGDYLDTQFTIAGKGKMLLEDIIGDIVYNFKPPHPSNLRLSELISYAVRNHSQDCLDKLLNCFFMLAEKSLQKQNEKYFHDWIFEFYRAYHLFGAYAKTTDFNIASDVSRRFKWLSDILITEIREDDKSPEQVEKITPYAFAYLSLCLHMLKTSAERCDISTFNSICEHIEQFLKNELGDIKAEFDIYRDSGQDDKSEDTSKYDLSLAYNELLDYKNLVYVIVGSWLLYMVKKEELIGEKVYPYIDKLIKEAPDLRGLLDLYAMPGMADIFSNHDNPLGFDSWDWPLSYYPKTGRCGTDFQIWIKPFYQFLIVKKALGSNTCGFKLKNIRRTEMANHKSLRNFLDEITKDDYSLPPEFEKCELSLSDEQLKEAKKNIIKILNSWPNDSDT